MPWKATTNPMANGAWVDIGFALLALLPAFIGLAIWRREESLAAGIAALAWFIFWIFWVLRITLNLTNDLNLTTFSPNLVFDYVLMISLAITAVGYAVAKVRNPLLTALALLAVVSWIFWALIGREVIWYGLAGFLPLILLLGYLVINAPPFLRATGWSFIFLGLTTQVAYQGALFETSSMATYAYGITDYAQTVESLAPGYISASGTINEHPESASEKNYVYRIGSFIPYFILENDRRVFDDSLLDFFTCLNHAGNDENTYRSLKTLGFRYMVVDPTIALMEKDPNGTLHQKVTGFVGWADRMGGMGMIKIIKMEKHLFLLELV
jgi:hypothetical protein